eukprot:31167-Pelagococcus_subviridis.AAC.7
MKYPQLVSKSGMFTKFMPHIPVRNSTGTMRVVTINREAAADVHLAHGFETVRLFRYLTDVFLERLVVEDTERVFFVRLAQAPDADREPTHPPQLHAHFVHGLTERYGLARDHGLR